MNRIYLQTNPTETDFEELMLQIESIGFGRNGILQPHDARRMRKEFSENGCFLLFDVKRAIGLTTFRHEHQCAIIDYKWLHPDYRGKKLGHLFGQMVYDELLRRSVYYILVEPATQEGYGMASTFGYKKLSETPYKYSTNYYYKFIKQGRLSHTPTGEGYEMVIWDDYRTDVDPTLCYSLDDTMEDNPILTIMDFDNYFEIRKDGVPITRKRVIKRGGFDDEKELQNYGLFYLFTNLSELKSRLKFD